MDWDALCHPDWLFAMWELQAFAETWVMAVWSEWWWALETPFVQRWDLQWLIIPNYLLWLWGWTKVVGSMVTWAGCSTPLMVKREMGESMTTTKIMQILARFGKIWLCLLNSWQELCPGPYMQHVVMACAKECVSLWFCSPTFSNEHLPVSFQFTCFKCDLYIDALHCAVF